MKEAIAKQQVWFDVGSGGGPQDQTCGRCVVWVVSSRRQVHVSILISESDVVGEDLKLQSPFCQSDRRDCAQN